jgi:arylsulfatase A
MIFSMHPSPPSFLKKLKMNSSPSLHSNLLIKLITSALIFSISLFSYAADEKKESPNIVFLLIDDLGWFQSPLQMDPAIPNSKSDFITRMPVFEQFAANGMTFRHAYSPAPVCGPSRASIQTGKSCAALRYTDLENYERNGPYFKLLCPEPPNGNRAIILPEEVCIPEAIKRVNPAYATGHFGKWDISKEAHGFDVFDGFNGNSGPAYSKDPNPKDTFGITERGRKFMAQQVAAKKPFFMQLSYYAVHNPPISKKSTLEHFSSSPAKEKDKQFAAMGEDVDTAIGELLKDMERLGIAKNTYVFITGDNGTAVGRMNGDNPIRGEKLTLFEGGIRVPLLVQGPGIQAGSICEETVCLYDFQPTMVELVGGQVPIAGLDGDSIVPLFKDPKAQVTRSNEGFLFHYPHYRGKIQAPDSALILGDYKIILFYETNTVMLFNLREDPAEKNDLSKKDPTRTTSMRALLEKRLASANAAFPTKNPNYSPDAKRPPNAKKGEGKGDEG